MEAATKTKDTQQIVSTRCEVLAAGVSDLHWQRQAGRRQYVQVLARTPGAADSRRVKRQRRKGLKLRVIAVRATMRPFINSTCYKCEKKGDLAKMCKTKVVKELDYGVAGHHSPVSSRCVTPTTVRTRLLLVMLEINGNKVTMELDTGAAVSVMSESECVKFLPSASFKKLM